MNRLELVEKKVRELYEQRNPERAEWADWLYENHVFLVRDRAKELSEKYNVNSELAEAAAMLHDIADSVINRFDEKHEEMSLQIAREILTQSGFSEEEIEIIVEDAIKLHGSFTKENSPKSIEGKILATADAVVHINSDFYTYGTEMILKSKKIEDVKKWAIPKMYRDFHNKIFFDEIREQSRTQYETLKKRIENLDNKNIPIK